MSFLYPAKLLLALVALGALAWLRLYWQLFALAGMLPAVMALAKNNR